MRKGEKMSDEHKLKMAEARRINRERRMLQRELGELRATDAEDVSLPQGYGSVVEHDEPGSASPRPARIPADPYDIWLLALDDETKEMFSEAELRETFAEYWKKAQAEKKTRRKKEIQDLALSTARSHLGLLPQQSVEALAVARQNAKPVSMMIQLPPSQDDGRPADLGLRVDGQLIPNGKRHYCTYGEAASLREQIYRISQMELQFKGQNTVFRSWLLGQAMGAQPMQIDATDQGIVR